MARTRTILVITGTGAAWTRRPPSGPRPTGRPQARRMGHPPVSPPPEPVLLSLKPLPSSSRAASRLTTSLRRPGLQLLDQHHLPPSPRQHLPSSRTASLATFLPSRLIEVQQMMEQSHCRARPLAEPGWTPILAASRLKQAIRCMHLICIACTTWTTMMVRSESTSTWPSISSSSSFLHGIALR